MNDGEHHWDKVCLSVMMTATAAIAAVFFVMELSGPGQTLRTAAALYAAGAMIMYILVGLMTARTVIAERGLTPAQIRLWKRNSTIQVFCAFGGVLVMLAAVVIAQVTIPAIAENLRGETPMQNGTGTQEENAPDGGAEPEPPKGECAPTPIGA